MNIFVAKLNYDTVDKFTGKSKGFGFVEMPNDDEGQGAIDALNDSEMDGRNIVVKKAEPRERRDNRGGGGGGYRGGGGGNRGGGGYDRNRGGGGGYDKRY